MERFGSTGGFDVAGVYGQGSEGEDLHDALGNPSDGWTPGLRQAAAGAAAHEERRSRLRGHLARIDALPEEDDFKVREGVRAMLLDVGWPAIRLVAPSLQVPMAGRRRRVQGQILAAASVLAPGRLSALMHQVARRQRVVAADAAATTQ